MSRQYVTKVYRKGEMMQSQEPKRILMVVSSPAVSGQTGWPIGFWWAELTHPFWEFIGRGFEVTIASTAGGPVEADGYSDPEHESGYSANDLISMGFKKSPQHVALLESTPRLTDLDWSQYDALFLVGGQGPMYTFHENPDIERAIVSFIDAGKPTAVVCHATVALLTARKVDGALVVDGRTWTGFSDQEEQYADQYVGQRIQPFWIETEARKLPNTTFVVGEPFAPKAVRDGNLITGQQQYSGAEAARAVINALAG